MATKEKTENLDEVIAYWLDYRMQKGDSLGVAHWVKVNDTLLILLALKGLVSK